MTPPLDVSTDVTSEKLDVAAHAAAVERAASGAVVTFAGVVRDHDGGREVSALRYVAHPDAAAVLARVVHEVASRHPVAAVACSHRTGDLLIGDVALAVAVSSPHRGEAFGAAAALVDAIKEHLPVWKQQVFADGTQEWVGSA